MTESVPAGIDRLDPQRLDLLLREAGWEIVGIREGAYIRFVPPGAGGARSMTVRVPLDQTAPEFNDQLASALSDIRRAMRVDAWAQLVSRALVAPSDEFRFLKKTATPGGLIAWTQGEELVAAARSALVAGAKAFMSPMKYYSNKHGRFANRFLDAVLMGQTAPGSFVVTALAPVNERVPYASAIADQALWEDDVDAARGRDIALAVVQAVEATIEAVAEYRSSGTLHAFEESVELGVSYEMASALRNLAAGSDGASVVVEWDPSVPPETSSGRREFVLQPGDVSVLDKAANMLVSTAAEPVKVSIVGRVHLLTKQDVGGPGTVGLENLSTLRPRKLRARLSPEDYSRALHAHDEDKAVIIEGTIQREGNLHWLYDGRLVSVLGPVVEVAPPGETRSPFQLPGQMVIGRDAPVASEEDEAF